MVNTQELLKEKNKELESSKVEIKKYEYSLKKSLIKRTPQEHLIRENEIMSKIFLEILLKYSSKKSSQKTDEEIAEILSQPNWREKAQFEVGDYQYKEEDEVSEDVGHLWAIPWLISAREPIEIIERLSKEKEEVLKENSELKEAIADKEVISGQLIKKEAENKEQALKIDALEKDLEEQELFIEQLEEIIEEEKIKVETNLDALEKAQEWRKRQLAEIVGEKLILLDKADKKIGNQKEQIKRLKKNIEEKDESLEEFDKRLEKEKIQRKELKRQLYLDNKPLPSLPKKESKFKRLGNKIKTKFQHLLESKKHQEQKLVAQIEIIAK